MAKDRWFVALQVKPENKKKPPIVEVHATPAIGNYETLCGLDGNDCGMSPAPLPWPRTERKITCKDCQAIILHCSAYNRTVFK